jgi:hypothetical protein
MKRSLWMLPSSKIYFLGLKLPARVILRVIGVKKDAKCMKIVIFQIFKRLKNEKKFFFCKNPESVQTFDGRF